MRDILDLSLEDLTSYVVENGYKPYKAKQIYSWLYKKRISDPDMMSDLSKELITRLKEDFYFENLKLVTKQVSKADTI